MTEKKKKGPEAPVRVIKRNTRRKVSSEEKIPAREKQGIIRLVEDSEHKSLA